MTTKEYKVVALRECPSSVSQCDEPAKAVTYWHECIASDERHNPDVENMVVLMLTTRRKVIGHYIAGVGVLDGVLVHPREIFRAAIVAAAHAIILMHNHPSGDPAPSEADVRVTRDLRSAGRILKMDLLDHVIVGSGDRPWVSMKELGYL